MNEPRENPEFRFCKQFFQFIMLDGKRCVIISKKNYSEINQDKVLGRLKNK